MAEPPEGRSDPDPERTELLKHVMKLIFVQLKKQYSGAVGVNVFQTGTKYSVTLKLTKGIDFDAMRKEINASNDFFRIKPDCSNFGGHEIGTIPFFLKFLPLEVSQPECPPSPSPKSESDTMNN